MVALVINGDQLTALNNPGAYTMYPSGYLVVGTHDYTKHYYSGSQRIASRIGDLSTVNNFEVDSLLKQKLETKKQNLQKQLNTIYKKANLGKPNFALAPQAPVDPAEQQCQNEYDALLQYWVNQLQPPPNENLDIKDCIKNLTTIYAQTQSYCQTIAIVKEQVRCYVDLGFNRQPIWWYHPDHLGSSSYLTDYSGIPSHYYDYLPSGEEMVSQNTSVYNNFYKFSGKELDEDTGLYYFGARYYDPKWSVWLSVDAMAEKYPNAGGYNYCLGNPVNLVDPDGKDIRHFLINHLTGNQNLGIVIYGKSTLGFYKSMRDIMRTNVGQSYLSQFMKNGQTAYGYRANHDGKYSDVNLNIYQVDLKGKDASKKGVFFLADADAVVNFNEVNGKLEINIWTGNDSASDVSHELFVHYSGIMDEIIKAYRHGGIKEATDASKKYSENDDHKALKNNDTNHPGVKRFIDVKKELEKENPDYKKEFKQAHETDQRRYKKL